MFKCFVWSGAEVCTSCRVSKMLSNAYFLANIGFDPAEGDVADKLENLQKKCKLHCKKKYIRIITNMRKAQAFLTEPSYRGLVAAVRTLGVALDELAERGVEAWLAGWQ